MTAKTRPTVLIVESDAETRAALAAALECEFDCLEAAGMDSAIRALGDQFVQVLVWNARCLVDPGRFIATVQERWPETERIALGRVTAAADPRMAQVLDAPFEAEQALVAARAAARIFQLARENERMTLEMRFLSSTGETKVEARRASLLKSAGFEGVLHSPASPLSRIVAAARQYASFDVPVLIRGEAGTGKRLMARAMHAASLRSDRPFCELNCAGLSDDLLELELFGARNGSVPAGQKSRIGLVQKADRGTLFLKNVHVLSCRLQMRLLRLVTEKAFQPVGGHETITSQLRLMCSAAETLPEMVTEGAFSSDLYYEISVSEILMPPLRVRGDDIPLLARALLDDLSARHSKPVHGFSDAALDFLRRYPWPGNIRELENEVTRMLIFAQDRVLGPDLISRHILQASPQHDGDDRAAEAVMTAEGSLKDRVEHIEARILRETLTRLRWNKSRAASELGLSRVGLRAKLERYGVAQPEDTRELEEG